MCGRYLLRNQPEWATHSPWKDYWQDINGFTPRYNIAPSQECPIIIAGVERPQLVVMRWGFRPSWAKASFAKINSRAESLFSSKMFSQAAKQTRCLVPADGFYEPKGSSELKSRTWHLFQFNDQRVFMMAGIYTRFRSVDEDYWNFSIVTTAANTTLEPVHHRMPVILESSQWEEWLRETHPIKLQTLLKSREYPHLTGYPVGDWAKNPRNEGPNCAKPIESNNLSLF
jgi:putative SOS response-associated peptidase YedK